jgi:hypothetical protein
VLQGKYKASAAILTAAIVVPGLLATRPADLRELDSQAGLRAEPVRTVDLGHCHGVRRELRFEWLKPGEEPTVPASPRSAVCLAVYEIPGLAP